MVQPEPGSESVRRDTILIGGSKGSLAPLLTILKQLPKQLPASVLVVQHRLPGTRSARALLAAQTSLRVEEAEDGIKAEEGVVYLAPEDRHLLISESGLRVLHGPRENLARPSIDVLFRSAAVSRGARCIGVILSGSLADGELGLDAVERCGGYTIVQDPGEAETAELPLNALRTTPAVHLRSEQIAGALLRALGEAARLVTDVPRDLQIEARAAVAAASVMDELGQHAERTHLTCPECDGPLWRLGPAGSEHFRCDVGHAYSTEALVSGQAQTLERALWVAYRTLIEHARLLDALAERGKITLPTSSAEYRRRAEELRSHANSVREAISAVQLGAGQA
jgi:two-component system chemotaxis response regulator CheB